MKDVQANESEHFFGNVTVKDILRDEVLARVLEEPKRPGGGLILAPETDRGYSLLAKVEKVGPQVRYVNVGEIVVLDSWKGRPFLTEQGRKVLIKECFIGGKVMVEAPEAPVASTDGGTDA